MQKGLPIPVPRILRWGCLMLGVLLAISQGALAHPPSYMKVTFDEGTGQLSVTITHTVSDPTTHYVKRVVLRQGTTVLLDTPYMSQPSPLTFTYLYPLPPEVTGGIEVKAECNLAGSVTRTREITRSTPTVTLSPATTPTTVMATPTATQPPATATPTGTTATATVPATAAPSPAAGGIGLVALVALAVLAFSRARR